MLVRPIKYRDPCAAFAIFADDAHAVLLDSAAPHDGKGRFSTIAIDPFCVIEATQTGVTINDAPSASDAFTVLERELAKYTTDVFASPAPFAGGAIGYLGYELGGFLERLPKPRDDKLAIPTMVIGFYDVIASFDHAERKAWIISHGWPEQTPDARRTQAEIRADMLMQKLAQAPEQLPEIDWTQRGTWQAELTRAEVERRIAKIIDYIRAGDIFQANFTQRFHAQRPADMNDFMLYRRLRALNPAPFAGFLRCGSRLSIAGASPERFLRLGRNGRAESHPVKGTRPRDVDPARDAALAEGLKTSAKDRAENLMIVDLTRNDLSRVCEPGSIQVPQLCALESFAAVHHLTSVVSGQLKSGAGPVDLLRVSFPGGSVTGAPKIRAMEIIHELEPAPRGSIAVAWAGSDSMGQWI